MQAGRFCFSKALMPSNPMVHAMQEGTPKITVPSGFAVRNQPLAYLWEISVLQHLQHSVSIASFFFLSFSYTSSSTFTDSNFSAFISPFSSSRKHSVCSVALLLPECNTEVICLLGRSKTHQLHCYEFIVSVRQDGTPCSASHYKKTNFL